MSTIPLIQCNSTQDCKIKNVICIPIPADNDTEKFYCKCHNNYFMRDDYNCTKLAHPHPPDSFSGLTPYSSIFLVLGGISFLVVVILMINISYKFRSRRINKVSTVPEEETYLHLQRINVPRNEESMKRYDDTFTNEEKENSLYSSYEGTTRADLLLQSDDQSVGYAPHFPENDNNNEINDDDNSDNYVDNQLPVQKLDRNSIQDREKIGEGNFGYVFKGYLRINIQTEDGDEEHERTVAVKRLKENASLEAKRNFWREANIMSSFCHQNILSLLYICPQAKNEPPEMVFEFMQFGDLKKLLVNNSDPFRNSIPGLPVLAPCDLLSISHQIGNGMEYLAGLRYVHRDLACRNCLVGLFGTELEVKIGDFGLSRDVYSSDYYKLPEGYTRSLPVRWMSPESIEFGKFTVESDIWSYGVVLWEIFNLGRKPHFGFSDRDAIKMILAGILLDIPQNCPREVANIMSACWKRNPSERIQFLEICARFSNLRKSLRERNEIGDYV